MLVCRCCVSSHQSNPAKPSPCSTPLKSLSILSKIQNSLASLTITQEFSNQETNPIECEYLFPVLEEGVVTGLKIYLPDGSKLTSKVEEKKKLQSFIKMLYLQEIQPFLLIKKTIIG